VTFLLADATRQQLHAASVQNHVEWMRRVALASDGEIGSAAGLHWVSLQRPESEAIVAVTERPGPEVREQIDDMVEHCRAKGHERLSYWTFDEAYAPVLGSWLGARGFGWGGRPHFMAIDLHEQPELTEALEISDGIEVDLPQRLTDVVEEALPCFASGTAAIRERMLAARPQRVWHAALWRDGRPVGQMSVNLTEGELGVCGLHETIILPQARTRGLGYPRFQWVCRLAASTGARYVITNAAEENISLYRVLGFRPLRFGQTWWLTEHGIRNPPPPEQVAFVEAIADGNVDALAVGTGQDLDARLPNGMTPLQLAAKAGRGGSAEWLVEHGATLDVISAWELGWKDRVVELFARDPGLVNARRPRSGKTLLHIAVERDDVALAELLLDAGADPTARDGRFDSTPLAWAQELRRGLIAARLRARMTGA
jgi:GNAT superfamily N-acetyltransferase